MGAAAADTVGALTPPRSPRQAAAPRSRSRSGSRGRRAGPGVGSGAPAATAAAGGARTGGQRRQDDRAAGVNLRSARRALGRACRRPEAEAEAPAPPAEAAALPGPAKTPSDKGGGAKGTGSESVTVRRAPAVRTPGPKAGAKRASSPNPHHISLGGGTDEVPYDQGRPASETLGVSPIRWANQSGSEGGRSSTSRSPGGPEAPWKRANRAKPGAKDAEDGAKGQGKQEGKRAKKQRKKGKGKGKAKGQQKGQKGQGKGKGQPK